MPRTFRSSCRTCSLNKKEGGLETRPPSSTDELELELQVQLQDSAGYGRALEVAVRAVGRGDRLEKLSEGAAHRGAV